MAPIDRMQSEAGKKIVISHSAASQCIIKVVQNGVPVKVYRW